MTISNYTGCQQYEDKCETTSTVMQTSLSSTQFPMYPDPVELNLDDGNNILSHIKTAGLTEKTTTCSRHVLCRLTLSTICHD